VFCLFVLALLKLVVLCYLMRKRNRFHWALFTRTHGQMSYWNEETRSRNLENGSGVFSLGQTKLQSLMVMVVTVFLRISDEPMRMQVIQVNYIDLPVIFFMHL